MNNKTIKKRKKKERKTNKKEPLFPSKNSSLLNSTVDTATA
jgi:hypothetical protein